MGTKMLTTIRLKIILNKGRHGILIHKLARVGEETEKFIDCFANDINLSKKDWLADNFKDGSLEYQLSYVGSAPQTTITMGREALKHIIDPSTTSNTLKYGISKKTFLQYARIANSIDADEVIELGTCDDNGEFMMYSLTKERFSAIEREVFQETEQYRGLQGTITAFFKDTGSFHLRELLTGVTVICKFNSSFYNTIWKLLEKRDTLVNVEGWFISKSGKGDYLNIESIVESAEYIEGDIDKFFGCDPNFMGNQTVEEYMAILRERPSTE